MDRRLFGIVPVGAHAEYAARNPDHAPLAGPIRQRYACRNANVVHGLPAVSEFQSYERRPEQESLGSFLARRLLRGTVSRLGQSKDD